MREEEKQFRTFCFDQSVLKVPVRPDEPTGRYFLDCPDLEEHPVYTKSGYAWVSVVQDTCPYHEGTPPESAAYRDCGSCRFFQSERPGDILGVCGCETLRRKPTVERATTQEEEEL